MGVDLRNLEEVEQKLISAEIDFRLPTIFLSECVLVYIEPKYSIPLLKWFSSKFENAAFVNYEQDPAPFNSVHQTCHWFLCMISYEDLLFELHSPLDTRWSAISLLYLIPEVNMNDRFSSVMLSNLRARGCSLAGVDFCLSLETQKNRFLSTGWSGCRAWDMIQVYQSISASDRHRIERLEMLDEGELLVQLFQHYCLVVAWKV
uniref:[phosphatase 2A protein]-leucine-carboxy methyltransferase n=1 Tax=Megaselia scalaris TaxID=36166 RepID=T1H3B6_MEGSC